MAAELGQTAAQFRLKDHNQGDREEDRETADEPPNHDQVQQGRDESQGQKNNRQPRQHFGAARAAKVKIAVVNPDTEQNDLDDAAPAFEPELEKFLHHGNTASAARSAATFSFTSWTRKISAPRTRKIAVSAIVGAARSLISEEPTSFPRKDLRDTPTASGRSCTRSRSRFLSSVKLCSSVLPKPIPGSNAMAMGSTPHSRARAYCCLKKSATSA